MGSELGCSNNVKLKANHYKVIKTAQRQSQIIISKDTGLISSCVGFASVNPNLQQFNVSGIGLNETIAITAPTGFEVSLSPNNNFSNTLTLALAADSVRDTIVYVRSSVSAKIGNNVDSVTVSSSGIIQKVGVASTIYGLPTVNKLLNITVKNQDTIKPISFNGTGTTFDWICDNPNIGLTNAGKANLPGFRATNITNVPVTATITVTPKYSLPGFIYLTNPADSTITKINIVNPNNTLTVNNIPNGSNFILDPNLNRGYLVSANDKVINTINLQNLVPSQLVKEQDVNHIDGPMAISLDGATLYAANNYNLSTVNSYLSVYNTKDGVKITDINLGYNRVDDLALSPNGENLYALIDSSYNLQPNSYANYDFLMVINLSNNQITDKISIGNPGYLPFVIQVSPDNNTLYVANSFNTYISVISATSKKEIDQINLGLVMNAMILSPDGTKLYAFGGNYGGSIMLVINTKTNQIMASLPLGIYSPNNFKISHDGNLIYISDQQTNNLLIIDAKNLKITNTLKNKLKDSDVLSFITSTDYYGIPSKFTITVNPTSSPILKTSAVTGAIATCQGYSSTNPNLQQFNVSGNALNDNIAITAPTGFEVSLSPDSNFSKNILLTTVADSVRDTTIFVRSDVTAKIGNTIDSVTVSSTGIIQKVGISSTIYALPTVNNLSNIVVAKGDSVQAISFSGTGTSYDWTCDNPNIGLTNAGGANLPAFRAINNTNAPITATITVKPRFSLPGFIYYTDPVDKAIGLINNVTDSFYKNINKTFVPLSFILNPFSNKGYLLSIENTSDYISEVNLSTLDDKTFLNTNGKHIYAGPMAINPEGTKLYVCHNTFADSSNNYISVFNLNDYSKITDINTGNFKPITDMNFSPDGKNLYALIDTSYNNNIVVPDSYLLVINTSKNQITNRILLGSNAYSVRVSPDNSTVYVANNFSQYLSVISTADKQETSRINVGPGYVTLVLSPDGTKIYAANDVSGISVMEVINTKTNQVIASVPLGFKFPANLNISQDGKIIYVVDQETSNLILIDANNYNIITTLKNFVKYSTVVNFITGTYYFGAPSTFTITVNPTIPVIAASNATGNITACEGIPSSSPNIEQFSVWGHLLNDNIVVTAPAGFEVSLSQASGYSNTLTLIKTSDSVTNTPIYIRSSSSAPVGSLNGIILVSSTGAASINTPVNATINSISSPTINISSSENNICIGSAINFNAVITNGGSSPTYQWLLNGNNVGINGPNFMSSTLTDGDIITCKLTNNAACTAQPVVISNSITVKVNEIPSVNAGGDKTIKQGFSTVLNASATGDIADITWSPIYGLSNYKILKPIANPKSTTKYTITVVSSSGCTNTSSAVVTVISKLSIPNAFSPNNDGINDTWNIKDIEGYPNCTVDIFNRYGTKVYSSRGYGVAWDGRYNNSDLPVGTYYYIINLNDGSSTISGYVALIR